MKCGEAVVQTCWEGCLPEPLSALRSSGSSCWCLNSPPQPLAMTLLSMGACSPSCPGPAEGLPMPKVGTQNSISCLFWGLRETSPL